ncbi:MAG: SpoIID/LytB domain-containing protein [Candidatus Omnitrophota bacterium]
MRFLILLVSFLLLGISSGVNADLDPFEEAVAYYHQARFSDSINVYKKIIKNNPNQLKAYWNLAYLYKDLLEYEQAIQIIKEALKIFEDNQLNLFLGQLYYLDGKPKQAIPHLNRLLVRGSTDPRALFYLGQCYEEIGQLTEAEDYYSEVIKLEPSHVFAYLRLANMFYQTDRLKQAVRAYQEVILLDPSITQVRRSLAECFRKLSEFPEAYEQYAKYVAIYPEDKLAQENLKEIKAKLGEEFFREKKKLISQLRQKKSIQVKASPFAKRAPEVRIGIAKIRGAIDFKVGETFEIIEEQSQKMLFQGKAESIYSLLHDKGGCIQLNDEQGDTAVSDLDTPFLIKHKSDNSVISIFDIPIGTGSFWAGWRDHQYRGIIEVIPESDGFWLVNLVNLEEYLYGVLPSEMPANWPGEALRAQAIAARTWAVKNKTRHRNDNFNFCSTVHCQVYKGAGAEMQVTNQAVDDTTGLILSYNSQLIDIFYSNNCGGCTQAGVVDAVSLDFDFPLSPLALQRWLIDEPDTFCNLKDERSANFRWLRAYQREQLQSLLDKSEVNIGQLLRIIPQSRAVSGHLTSIKLIGTQSNQVIEGEHKIRKILGNLLSSTFKIEVKYNQHKVPVEFIFYGAGFGHGKGLCQRGIKGMAMKGYDYRQILKHYYPDVQIERQY